MTTTLIDVFNAKNAHASEVFGEQVQEFEQGSYQWHRARLGVITASEAYKVLQKHGSATRDGYMHMLIHEIATKAPGEELTAKPIMWGREHEPTAREMMGFMYHPVETYPIVFKDDDMRCALSPDGVSHVVEEIKCSWNGGYYIDFLVNGKIPKKQYDEWTKQVQFGMWVAGLDVSGFTGFDPRMPSNMIKRIEVERDEKMMKQFDDEIPQFILEMDRKLEMIGLKFGDQWK